MVVTPRMFSETDEAYLRRLAEGHRQFDGGTIKIDMMTLIPVGFRMLTTILISKEGLVDAVLADRRQVFRLSPPPGDKESPYRFIERVAAACRRIDEF